jgi:hypothetical protein
MPAFEAPEEYDLYWGDFHKHLTGPDIDIDRLDEVLDYAAEHLDAATVLCYPFKWFRHGEDPGIREESVGTHPEFEGWWETIQDVSATHNDPGGFVTFPAHEWHGDRTRWGDHNVIYREEGEPLDDEPDLPDLYANLRGRPALALPHHTGYEVGNRGKDWDTHDPGLSPVMEVYSSHGSSEGVDTPVAMGGNTSMGPRTTGGSWQDGLDRGHRVGAIASNDGPGLPGTWNRGIAGLWATDLTRAALWEALAERRTYGVTGDRMRLWWEVDGAPLGSVVDAPAETGTARVACPQPLDRVELVHDGRMVERYTHDRTGGRDPDGVYQLLVEFHGGPSEHYGGFDDLETGWHGAVEVDGGELRAVTPRFVGYGQRYSLDGGCQFDLVTRRGEQDVTLPEGDVDQSKQGLILELEGDDATEVRVDLRGVEEAFTVPLADARERGHLFSLVEESVERIEREFDVAADDFENPDPFYHNARKVNVHRAHPRRDCATSVTFDLPQGDGDYYYVRAAQVDGQFAWSSPVWAV